MQEAFFDDLNRQVQAAYDDGQFTAVHELAEQRRHELQRELAKLTAGHELRRMSNIEREQLRRTWTPEKIILNEKITELHGQIRAWQRIEEHAERHAANEAHGWTIMPDGTCAKVLDDGRVISSHSYISRFTDSDGTVYESDGPGEQWLRRHRRHLKAFADRARAERIAKARRHSTPGSTLPRRREHRPRIARRAASSSSTSGSDPGDPDPDPPRRRRHLRHVSHALTAFLLWLGGAL